METQTFIRQLARAKTPTIPEPLRTRTRQSWMHQWGSLLACEAARAFTSSLLERRGQPGADGEAPPAADVLGTSATLQERCRESDSGLALCGFCWQKPDLTVCSFIPSQKKSSTKVRVPAPASGSGATEMVLVPVAMSGSALMSNLIDKPDEKRP